MILKIIKNEKQKLGFESKELLSDVDRTRLFYDKANQQFLEIIFKNSEKINECIRLTRVPYEEDLKIGIDKESRPAEGYSIYAMNENGQTIERLV